MVKLIAQSPCAGLLPRTIGQLTLSEVVPDHITAIGPFAGQMDAVSAAMKMALGVGFPAPNRMLGAGDTRAIWCGKDQAVVLGPDPVAPAGAMVVDQSDAWAIVRLEGADAVAVLQRLTPIDLRAGVFEPGHTARTLLGHMTVSITRLDSDLFEVMAMRSMAGTLVHELAQAAEGVAARAAL